MVKKMVDKYILEMSLSDDKYDFTSSIASAIDKAELEIQILNETIESIQHIRPNCDKLDYILAASSGALCGLIDIFLVGKPGDSPLQDITDKWFDDRVKDFAKLCGWNGGKDGELSSAIKYLEGKFKVPYDQRGAGDKGSSIPGLHQINHHFKSLAHNPSLLGLFFSILEQFTNTSHFVSVGQYLTIVKADDKFELKGETIPAKFFCAIVNWFGHLISDVSGSGTSKGRGLGIPSPLWTWTNDIIVLKNMLRIPSSQFDRSVNELALEIYKNGFDARFQTAQTIPVFVNEMIVRLFYSIRRLVKYFKETETDSRSPALMWERCEPFTNATVKRMLTVAHGTFCLLDIGDAGVHSFVSGVGTFDPGEFFLRLNIAGVGRFTISLYGEVKRAACVHKLEQKAEFAKKEKVIVENYLTGLRVLAEIYNDSYLINFADNFESSNLYIQAFNKSALLAEKRGVPKDKILKNKSDIDAYFLGGEK